MATTPTTSLRPKQAAEFLGVGLTTFWRWTKERKDFPKLIKIGPRTTIVPLDKLTAWRDAQSEPLSGADAAARFMSAADKESRRS